MANMFHLIGQLQLIGIGIQYILRSWTKKDIEARFGGGGEILWYVNDSFLELKRLEYNTYAQLLVLRGVKMRHMVGGGVVPESEGKQGRHRGTEEHQV